MTRHVRNRLAWPLLILAACGSNATGSQLNDAAVLESDAAMPETDAGVLTTCHRELDDEQCAALKAMIQPLELPPAVGNEVAESVSAAVLGFNLFFDIRLSRNREVRCETCHSVDRGFADGHAVPIDGIGPGLRNSPTVLNAARHTLFLWDGRADSLWSQPLMALENPDEMNFTRLELAHAVGTLYPVEYEKAFGAMPDITDLERFPAIGKPGDAAFDGMAPEDQLTINGIAANVGKAFEAYLRKIATGPSRVDRYLAEMFDADPGYAPRTAGTETTPLLAPDEERGLIVFAKAGCTSCHSGPQLSDDKFHNLGVPALPDHALDEGRTQPVIDTMLASPFNAAGPFVDGAPHALEPAPALPGGFRTPALRNLAKTAPYGHNGAFRSLAAVVDFHLAGGGQDPATFVGKVDHELKKVELSRADRAALVAFLKALEGAYPPLPWGQWPSGNG